MKNKILLIAALLLSAFAFLPDRTVTGIVTDLNKQPLPGVSVTVKGTSTATLTDTSGHYSLQIPAATRYIHFSLGGYETQQAPVTTNGVMHVSLKPAPGPAQELAYKNSPPAVKMKYSRMAMPLTSGSYVTSGYPVYNTENYNPVNENGFQIAAGQPVTTFSADVDRAAYSNVRRFLNMGQMPPVDAVRIEEMINYFDYNYPQPTGKHPLSVTTELTDSPWNKGLRLLQIGLQAQTIQTENLPASNLVFLVDVSGSMMAENKLPLLKQAFKMLVDQLRAQDKVSLVVYAGAAGVILQPTSGNEKMKIREALDNLQAGGSTAGGEGIRLAYQLARENFQKKGNNRVILATDGDFNVGVSSEGDLQRLIEKERESGVYLSIMGFGMGNYKDSNIETLADKGNGNYAYIDNIQEARKVFVQEFGGTLFTVAKDVKLQIEFNPKHVKAYRLIGYENRALKNEEFHDDKKDAGEMGAGHTVTALYEIIPTGMESSYLPQVDTLKYQKVTVSEIGKTDELLTVKIRYKKPDSDISNLFDVSVSNSSKPFSSVSESFRFAASVAAFGLLLRESAFKGSASYEQVIGHAKTAFGKDEEGYRSEFVRLVKTAQALDHRKEMAKK